MDQLWFAHFSPGLYQIQDRYLESDQSLTMILLVGGTFRKKQCFKINNYRILTGGTNEDYLKL